MSFHLNELSALKHTKAEKYLVMLTKQQFKLFGFVYIITLADGKLTFEKNL